MSSTSARSSSEKIFEALCVYALGDVKHGWAMWTIVVSCLFRDLFLDPDAALYLTKSMQEEFVSGFNNLLVTLLMGTEISSSSLAAVYTREDIVRSIRYNHSDKVISKRPPGRVELLVSLLSPWANITFGGCRYLWQVRAETLRKIRVFQEYFSDRQEESLFNVLIGPAEEKYVLLGLTEEECRFDPGTWYVPVPLRGWANQPGHPVPAPDLQG